MCFATFLHPDLHTLEHTCTHSHICCKQSMNEMVEHEGPGRRRRIGADRKRRERTEKQLAVKWQKEVEEEREEFRFS